MTHSPDLNPLDISGTQGGCIVSLLIQPRASKNELVGILNGNLKVRLTSPPIDGAANSLCIEFFARILKTSRSRIQIVAGAASRHKRLSIEGVSPEEFRAAIIHSMSTDTKRRS
jgi:uncharacterized protein (TIGR00251 family)